LDYISRSPTTIDINLGKFGGWLFGCTYFHDER